MTSWKRVGLSFAAALIAELLIALISSVPDGRRLFFEHIFGFMYFASIGALPGWLIALPIIAIPKKAIPLPWWALALIGASIGPGLTLAFGIYVGISEGYGLGFARESYEFVWLATLVSALTTALYLTALKLYTRPTPTPQP